MKLKVLFLFSLSLVMFCLVHKQNGVTNGEQNALLEPVQGAANLKQSLREIASEAGDSSDLYKSKSADHSTTDQDISEFGSILNLAPSLNSKASDSASSHFGHHHLFAKHGNKADSSGSHQCGKACLNALASRMLTTSEKPDLSSQHSFQLLTGENTVGAERERREKRKTKLAEERSKFIESEMTRMNEAVARGWKDLKNGLYNQAKSELKSAQYFHRAMVHLLQGSSELNRNLRTPGSIKQLRNALYSTSPKHVPVPKKLKNILEGIPDRNDDRERDERYERTPSKLEAILKRRYGNGDAKLNRKGQDRAFLESDNILNSRHETKPGLITSARDSDVDFEALLSNQLKEMRDELNHGNVGSARAALNQASFYLQKIRDASHVIHGNGAKVRKLKSRYDGLHRTLRQYEARQRAAKAIIHESSKRFGRDNFEAFAYPQKLSADSLNTRALFDDAIRNGVEDLQKGEIGRAQGKLVEARYYANSQGYLHVKPTYDSLQRHNARTAQVALKLLAKAILRKESKGKKQNKFDSAIDVTSDDTPEDRRKPSLKDVIQTLYSDVKGGTGKNTKHRRRQRKEKLHSHFPDENEKSYHVDGRQSANNWRDLLHPDSRSDLFAAANGQQEENILRDHEAKRKEKADCNSLLCLLPSKPHIRSAGRGPSLQSMAGLGGLKANDFAKTKTDFHTGLDLGKRLKRGGVVPKELKDTNPDSGSGSGSLSSVSMRDAEADVLRQEAKDAKKSMAEALVAYKSLLHQEVAFVILCIPVGFSFLCRHNALVVRWIAFRTADFYFLQVKKEEKNSLTNPMIAIMAPHGRSALQLSKKESNPENLKLSPADVLSSVGHNSAKKAIITEALKGHDKVGVIGPIVSSKFV